MILNLTLIDLKHERISDIPTLRNSYSQNNVPQTPIRDALLANIQQRMKKRHSNLIYGQTCIERPSP